MADQSSGSTLARVRDFKNMCIPIDEGKSRNAGAGIE
jgi:hypothetical protein